MTYITKLRIFSTKSYRSVRFAKRRYPTTPSSTRSGRRSPPSSPRKNGLRHSLCHGRSAGPCPWLIENVPGVKIVKSGMKVLEINPFRLIFTVILYNFIVDFAKACYNVKKH